MDIITQIKDYMRFRGQVYPNSKSAFEFAITELGEFLTESVSDQDSATKIRFRLELGDLYQMLSIACYEEIGRTMEDISNTSRGDLMVLKPSKTNLVISMCHIMDCFTRKESAWVRNNPEKQPEFEFFFKQAYEVLCALSLKYAGSMPSSCMYEKWNLKGYSNET